MKSDDPAKVRAAELEGRERARDGESANTLVNDLAWDTSLVPVRQQAHDDEKEVMAKEAHQEAIRELRKK